MTVSAAGTMLWALLQLLSVIAVLDYWRHLPADRQLEAPGGVVVILSVRDDWDGGAALIARLQRQSGVAFRLLIAASGNCPQAQAWAELHPAWIEAIAAGRANDEGQKIHKLRAALAALRAEDRFLVFIDADILPPERLVGRLLFPLVRGKAELSSGCRLLLPARLGLGAIGAIEMQVTTMPRLASGTMPWGGAMAITRSAADRLGLAQLWAGRLSDDLSLGLRARAAGLRLRAVRDLLVASPLDDPMNLAWAFLVRQYRHVWTNSRALWARAFGIVLLPAAGWAMALTVGGWRALAIGYGAAWARAGLRYRILAAVLEPGQMPAARRSLLWDAALPCAVAWAHLLIQIIAAMSERISWGGYDYQLRQGRVVRMNRAKNV